MSTTVRDHPEECRYEVYDGRRLAGFAAYRLSEGRISFEHTEVDPELKGKGLAKQLVTEALNDAGRRGLAVLPKCPYVRKVIAKHPGRYLELVPVASRAAFDLDEIDG